MINALDRLFRALVAIGLAMIGILLAVHSGPDHSSGETVVGFALVIFAWVVLLSSPSAGA